MGIIDRAFGADKNSVLADRLSFHWLAVSSHYENHLKKNDVPDEQRQVMDRLVSVAKQMSIHATASKKGFGFIEFDKSAMTSLCEELLTLIKSVNIQTEKPQWIIQAISATLDILNGNTKPYQRNQYWFAD